MNLIELTILILGNNKIIKYFYPIFPQTKNLEDIVECLKNKKTPRNFFLRVSNFV